MKRRSLLLASVVLLLTCIALTDSAWAVAPYFRYCNVKASNTPDGMITVVTAEIHHPTGSVPEDIFWVIVEGPGGFYTTLYAGDYDPSLEVFTKAEDGTPAIGEYKFTVIDFEGARATSTYYRTSAAQLPIVDSSSLRAFGNLTSPTLTWSDFSNYNGNLLFKVTVFDSVSKPVWTSSLTGITSVTLPSTNPVLTLNETYMWTVTAVDSIRLETVDNQSVCNPVTLSSAAGQAGFGLARVYKTDQPSGAGTLSYVNAQVFPALPAGSSLVVSGPGGFSHTFQAGECSGTGSSTCTYGSTASAADGIYTFKVKDSNGNTTGKNYHYFKSTSVPRADETTFRACTEPPGLYCSGTGNCTRLAWSAPAQASPYAPLFYSVYVFAADDPAEKTVWSSLGLTNPSCVVPSDALQPGTSYQWRLYVQDVRWPFRPNNLAKSSKTDLIVDDSKPNFYWGAGVDIRTDPEGIFTAIYPYVNDPSQGGAGLSESMTLKVEGPNGLSYTFDRTADFLQDLWQPGYQYLKRFSGVLSDGILTFTLTYPGGSLVTHDALRNGTQQIPLADDTTFQITTDVWHDPARPTISWSAIDGYPGHLYYRLKIVNVDEAQVYYSSREPYTSQTVPAGVLQPGALYRCRVEAFDDPSGFVLNNRSNSNYIELKLTENTVPGIPRDVQAAAGSSSAAVSFLPPSDGGSPITGYTVTSIPEGKTATGPESPIIVEGLTNGTTYTFTVTATNNLGTGPPSEESNKVKPSATCATQLAGTWRMGALVTGLSQPWWDRARMTINADGTVTAHEIDSEMSEYDFAGKIWRFPYGLWLMNNDHPNPTTLCQVDVGGTLLTCTETWFQQAGWSTNLVVATKEAATPVPAYSLADLAGTWRAFALTSAPTPSWKRMTFTVDGNGILAGTATSSNSAQTVQLSGRLVISANGTITCNDVTTGDACTGMSYEYAMDAGKSLIQGVGTDSDNNYGIWVGTKMAAAPTTYTTADLAGTWEVNLLQSSDDSPEEGYWQRIHLQVDSNGAFKAAIADSNGAGKSGIGQMFISSAGVVTCPTCSDGETWKATLDAGKTVLVGTVSDNSHELQLFVGTKRPAAPPTLAIGAPSAASTKTGPVTYTVTYTGASNITLSPDDILLEKTGTADGTVTVSGTGTTTRTVTLSSITGSGTLGISIGPWTASNSAGPCSEAGPSRTFIVANPPTLSLSNPSAPSTVGGPITYTLTYSAADTISLKAADITLNRTGSANGMVQVSGTDDTTRTVTVSSITGVGTLSITIASGTARNLSGKSAGFGPSAKVSVVNAAPGISIGPPSLTATKTGPVTYTVTYTKADNISLSPDDITLNATNATAGEIVVEGTGSATRTVTLSSIGGDGTLGISIAAGTADNAAGQSAEAGPSGTFTVTNTPPSIAISDPSVPVSDGSIPISYMVNYTGASKVNLSASNITLISTGTATGTITVTGIGKKTRLVTLSSLTGTGTLGIQIAPGTATNLAGACAGAGPSTTVFVTKKPKLTISPPSVTAASGGPVTYTVTYTRAQTITLSPTDITLNRTGTANASTINVTGAGNTRTVELSGITGNGTLGISIAAGTASNIAGQPSPAAGPSGTFNVTNTVVRIYQDTTRSGDVRTSETWRGVIDVTGDVTVYAPAVLTIEPGTTVRFAARSDDQAAGGNVPITDTNFPDDPAVAPSGMSAIVVWDGTLYAVGTPDNRITFTSSSSTPSPSDWHALLYYDANGRMNVQYSIIEYGYYGIAFAKTTTNDRVIVKNNEIRHIVACGVCCSPNTSVTLTISNNDISYCGHEAIDTHNLSNVVIDSNVLHDSWNGLVVMDNEPIITNNQFINNGSAIYTSNSELLSHTTGNTYIGNKYHTCSSPDKWFACPDEN